MLCSSFTIRRSPQHTVSQSVHHIQYIMDIVIGSVRLSRVGLSYDGSISHDKRRFDIAI